MSGLRFRFTRYGFGPGAVSFPVQHRQPRVIAKKCRLAALKGFLGPSIVRERLGAIRRSRESESRALVRGIIAPIIELNIDVSSRRIHGHPLKKLISAVVNRIAV